LPVLFPCLANIGGARALQPTPPLSCVIVTTATWVHNIVGGARDRWLCSRIRPGKLAFANHRLVHTHELRLLQSVRPNSEL
jgi:hypothetical protein